MGCASWTSPRCRGPTWWRRRSLPPLGLRTSGGPLIADVKAYLRPRRLVLLLDNFEQVTEAAPPVAELMAAAAGLVVLVTSRTVLRLSGEHEFPVEPLPTPLAGAAGGLRLVGLQGYASVRLFAERAHAAAPGFELTSENAEAVAEICRRLDGLPLAIELAAARVRLLPPQALLGLLDDRMSLLTGGARDLPERQRTLRNTLDWSFGLLSPAGQALFSRLGVFPGTFDLEAAEAVGGAYGSAAAGQDQAGEIIDTLGSLVDASLIRDAERASLPRFSLLLPRFSLLLPRFSLLLPRFSLLETIRDYARERLRENGQWKEAHDRHAAHYLELAESAGAGLEGPSSAGAGLEGPSQVAWLDRLEAEHDNLGAAISWFLDQGQPGPALQLGAMTWQYWWFRGHTEESARYGEVIVASGEKLPPPWDASMPCSTRYRTDDQVPGPPRGGAAEGPGHGAGGGGRQRVKRVPTVFGTNVSLKRRPIACWARHPVQCAGTSTCGAISARSSSTRGISGSNSGPFRWKPPIAAYRG